VSSASFTDLVAGDTVTVSATGTFSDKNVGTNKTVNLTETYAGADRNNYTITAQGTTTANITAKALTINTDIASTTKVYDGTTNVDITSANLTGVIGDDAVTASGSGNFDNKNVGTNKTITVAYTLSGNDAGNYSLDGTTATGDITAKAITVTGITTGNKVYDGDNLATDPDGVNLVDVSSASFTDLVAGDTVTVSATGTFSDENVGTNKTVNLSETYAGADRNNYTITAQGTTTANITAKAITVTGITAGNKVYDGNTTASINVSAASFTDLVAGDTVTVSATGTFSDENVGTNKTVNLTETYAGADRNNYTITAQGTATGNITQKGLSATISAIDKVYDGTNNATVSMNLTGYINDETLTTSGVVAIFNDVNAGERTVTVQSINLGDGDNGGLASNYSISTGQTDTATITPATLSITAANAAKFVPQSDPSFTVIYNGFVGDDDASDLNTIGSVVRIGADSDAGTYEDVIQASGYADNNYIFDYTNGDFTIVPIDGLIINLGDYQINYGGDTSYSSASASYWDLDTNQIKSDLSPVITGNDFLVNYGEAQVTFEISPVSSSVDCASVNCYSSSNRLKVGGYNLGAAANSLNKVNITDVTISGSMNILRKIIDPDLLTISEVSKVYDGSTAIASVTASYVQDNSVVYIGDDLQIQATGSYSSRHVGTGKSINIDLLLSGNDANNYAFEIDAENGTTLNLNRGTITQRDSVTWAGAAAGGLWSSATSWVDGAIPDLDNVATIIIPVNTATIMDVDEFGTSSSTINNSGTVIINHTNNFNLSNIISGTGSLQLSGEGTITLSGNNTHTGSTDMTDSHVVIAHANGLGDSALISNNGSLTINSGLTLDEITVTGPIKLLTDVNVLNDATFGGNVEVLAGTAADPLEINSTTGDITFNGTLTAGSGSKAATRSLQINGNYKEGDDYTNAGNVTFNDRVGYAFNGQIFTNLTGTNFYNFDITGNSININADIMTFNAQEYTGPVLIGDNGSNGLTRRLVSIDPSVTFNHSVNDSDGTHTLIVEAYALSASDPAPTITANGEIGDQTAFANPVQFITGVHDNSLNNPDNIWGNSNSLTDHVGQSINIRGVVSNSRGVNFNNFAANNAAAAAPVNNGSSAASNNGFTGGNQFGIVQQLLNQIRQNSQLITAATNTKPVVEVGVILENCEAISDDSECLAQ
jgi:hypothetical protein